MGIDESIYIYLRKKLKIYKIMPNNAQSAVIDTYEVNDSNNPVSLTVKIGFRQTSLSTVFINEVQIKPRFDQRSIDGKFVGEFSTPLDTNINLQKKDLHLSVLVFDIDKDDDKTSVTIILNGGVKDKTWRLGPIMVDTGGVVLYTADIGFFKRNKNN